MPLLARNWPFPFKFPQHHHTLTFIMSWPLLCSTTLPLNVNIPLSLGHHFSSSPEFFMFFFSHSLHATLHRQPQRAIQLPWWECSLPSPSYLMAMFFKLFKV